MVVMMMVVVLLLVVVVVLLVMVMASIGVVSFGVCYTSLVLLVDVLSSF